MDDVRVLTRRCTRLEATLSQVQQELDVSMAGNEQMLEEILALRQRNADLETELSTLRGGVQ